MEALRASKPCAICNSTSYKVLHYYPANYYDHKIFVTHSWDGGFDFDLQIVRCNNCGLVFQNPCFTEDGLKFLYPESIIPDKLNYEKEMSNQKFGYIIDSVIAKFYPKPAGQKILDIGTRYGVLPELLTRRGFDAHGIEYNNKCVETARKSGFSKIHQGTISNVKETLSNLGIDQVDIIIMIDVIEHLLDPCKDLSELAQLQRSNDRIIIKTMDLDSLGYRLFGKDWYFIHAQHTYYFNEHSLTLLFNKIGYSVEHIHRINKVNNITTLVPAIKKYFRHKRDRKQPIDEKKRWFATYRPSLFDLFTVVLVRN